MNSYYFKVKVSPTKFNYVHFVSDSRRQARRNCLFTMFSHKHTFTGEGKNHRYRILKAENSKYIEDTTMEEFTTNRSNNLT